ncbi:MAG: dephospho-CoA kinase [Acidobacteriota bacterium]
MISVGLTGNIGCGKSTVAAELGRLGAALIDADVIVHELLAAGGAGVEPVLTAFPSAEGSDDDGARCVDRQALGGVVFADDEARKQLEHLLHPLVIAENWARLDRFRGEGVVVAVTEAALLLESALSGSSGESSLDRFDKLLVVTCDEDVQLARVLSRSGDDQAEGEAREKAVAAARARMEAQMPQAEKAARADWVVDNSGDLEALRARVLEIWEELVGEE